MKFIKLITFLGLSFSNHSAIAASAIPEPIEDEVVELDQRPRLRGFDTEFINRMGMKSNPKSSEKLHNPQNCPPPSQAQLLGNQCTLKKDKRTICCKAGYSWVQCSKVCPPNPPSPTTTAPTAPNAEDYEYEDYDEVDAIEEE